MKKLICILFSIALVSGVTFSCKKKKEPEPAPAPAATTTYSNLTLGIALLDRLNAPWTGTFSTNTKAIIHCGGVAIDSLIGLDTTCVSMPSFDQCAMSSMLNISSKSFKIQDGADNYLDIYDNGLLIAQSKIMFTPYTYLNAVIASSSPGTENVNGPGACLTLCVPTR